VEFTKLIFSSDHENNNLKTCVKKEFQKYLCHSISTCKVNSKPSFASALKWLLVSFFMADLLLVENFDFFAVMRPPKALEGTFHVPSRIFSFVIRIKGLILFD
jgi:hypothetical protein